MQTINMNSTFLTSKTWNITCFKFFRSQQKCNPNRTPGILLHSLNETFHKSNLRKSLFLRNQLVDRQKIDILRKFLWMKRECSSNFPALNKCKPYSKNKQLKWGGWGQLQYTFRKKQKHVLGHWGWGCKNMFKSLLVF